jgi:hypothetical protein
MATGRYMRWITALRNRRTLMEAAIIELAGVVNEPRMNYIPTVVLHTVETEHAPDRNCAATVSESRSLLCSNPPHSGNRSRP